MEKAGVVVLALLCLVAPAFAQTQVKPIVETKSATLLTAWDMDGEAADDDQIVTIADLLNGGNSFTIAAQPDVCRLIDMTVTDANSSITAGTVTVTGTDCLGYARVCTFDFGVVATRGSGVKTIPVTTGPPGVSCYLRSVASFVSASIAGSGGAGVDQVKAGYTTNAPLQWAAWGRLRQTSAEGRHGVDPFASFPVTLPITTAGAVSTTVTSVGSQGSFTNVVAGDLLRFVVNGVLYERSVAARASENSITISSPGVNIPAAGVPFTFKHLYVSSDPYDEMWFSVVGWRTLDVVWSVDNNVDTGGVYMKLECTPAKTPDWPAAPWVVIPSRTGCDASGCLTASAATQAAVVEAIDLTLAPFQFCRVGWKFGTGDDADGAGNVEDLNAEITLGR